MQSFSREFVGVAFGGRCPLTGTKVSVSGGSTVDNIPYVSSIGLCIENAREYWCRHGRTRKAVKNRRRWRVFSSVTTCPLSHYCRQRPLQNRCTIILSIISLFFLCPCLYTAG